MNSVPEVAWEEVACTELAEATKLAGGKREVEVEDSSVGMAEGLQSEEEESMTAAAAVVEMVVAESVYTSWSWVPGDLFVPTAPRSKMCACSHSLMSVSARVEKLQSRLLAVWRLPPTIASSGNIQNWASAAPTPAQSAARVAWKQGLGQWNMPPGWVAG